MFIDKSLYADKKLKDYVKCPNHLDKNPSAILNESNVYCFACGKAFFFESHKHKNIYDTNSKKAETYHSNLINSENTSAIKSYLVKRNILSNYILKDFQLGFEVEKNALVFPIKNIYGDVSGFGFRSILDDQKPKYWNSPGNEKCDNEFEKSNNLYGIDKVTDKCEHLIICEGYICVISAFKKEFKNDVCFVAAMGTALNKHHLPLLLHLKKVRSIKKISLMFDNDEPGRSAALSAIKVLLDGGIFPNIIYNFNDGDNLLEYKDIDELLQKNDGDTYLKKLISGHCHDFFDYLLKVKIPNEELSKYVTEHIKNKKKKGEYAAKLCSKIDLYKDLKLGRARHQNVLSLNKEAARNYFCKKESFFNHKLPKYFDFQPILEWAKAKVKILNKSGFKFVEFRKIENANYKILGNKNGEYSWRQYQIINPLLYVKLVDVICSKWEEIQNYFQKDPPKNIFCASVPAIKNPDDKFANDSASQIINWWEEIEQDSIRKSLKYKYVTHTDIVDCYGSIYTHSIPWALHTKQHIKQIRENIKNQKEDSPRKDLQREYNELLGNQIDDLLQHMSHGQTNGIPQGSVLMDFIAEILLHYIDKELSKKIENDGSLGKKGSEFYILRYRDDYRIFTNEIGDAKKVLRYLSEVLVEASGMRLSPEKTEVSSCVVSGSIKKDKLYYFECFKEHDSIRKNLLNIYLFSKKFPNSGSIMKLLKSFDNQISAKINQISLALLENNQNQKVYNFDPFYVISILSEIMYRNTRTYSSVCDTINDMLSIMKNDDRKEIIENISEKMNDVPNSELLCIWLERMTHIDGQDKDGWYDFYLRCKANESLIYKQYQKHEIWGFTPGIDVTDMPMIIDNKVIDALDRAYRKVSQSEEINQSIFGKWTEDEANIFAMDDYPY